MGRLIAIEGLDGSGKATQTEFLYNQLIREGISVKKITFPNYEDSSSALVKLYLNGELSTDLFGVNAFGASSFYAVDRYASFLRFWGKDYIAGTVILADRYTTSNAIYQMAKLPKSQWNEFLEWLTDYEYSRLGLPEPNPTIFLNMEPRTSQKLLKKRYSNDDSKKDIHEKNIGYLEMCHESALYLTEKLGWIKINCCHNGEPLHIESISQNLWRSIKDIIIS